MKIEIYKTNGIDTIGYINDAPAQWRGDPPTHDGAVYWSNPGDEMEFAGYVYEVTDTCEWEQV